jgi:hypothetical protein
MAVAGIFKVLNQCCLCGDIRTRRYELLRVSKQMHFLAGTAPWLHARPPFGFLFSLLPPSLSHPPPGVLRSYMWKSACGEPVFF